jgi:putative two-component system response regulator
MMPALDAPSFSRRQTVLVVDDDQAVRSFFARLLSADGYIVDFAGDGPTALSQATSTAPDVVLLDLNLPELDGFEVCRRLKRDAATRLTPVIIVTGLNAREERVKGLDAGADDFLTKPVDTAELLARVRSAARVKHYTDDLDSVGSIIMTIANMIEVRDGYGEGHCYRMANYATSLGRSLSLDEADVRSLYRGAFLHDIGMLAVPESVLGRNGPLQPEEYALIKSHPVVGDRLCSNLRSLQTVRPIVRHHHERLDGSGYPDGLQGDQISLLAQIVGVVDVYEAVTTQRPYQTAKSSEEAIAVLQSHVERGWRQRRIVAAFAEVVRRSNAPPAAAPPSRTGDRVTSTG